MSKNLGFRISDFGFCSSAGEVDLGSVTVANQIRGLKREIRNPKFANPKFERGNWQLEIRKASRQSQVGGALG